MHYAARNGHSKVCQLILENVQEKHPKNYDGWTPLHWAAQNGHSELCQFILENVQENNPKNHDG